MAVKAIPDGYHSVTPYLIVKGAAQLIDFVKQAFGAQETFRMPGGGGIMHAEVRIGDSMVMMSDAMGEYGPMPTMLFLYVEDVDAVYKRALKAGGVSTQEPEDQFWGDRAGAVKDAFGNQWWIATHVEDVPIEELERRQRELAQRQA
ncbi:MAG TPA: VOC family protein [Dehalococcoidia bacterium]|nr:VOC family protein [Dehalococcoidia bacterium]